MGMILCFIVGGLLVGGAISLRQQHKPIWVSVLLVVLAALFVWLGFTVTAGGS